jgi:hypothetical protein
LLPDGFGQRANSLKPLHRFQGIPHVIQYTRLCISRLDFL